ncbi:hypothetical protein ACFL36_06975 [Thermodesulfobacteriota bacterium]
MTCLGLDAIKPISSNSDSISAAPAVSFFRQVIVHKGIKDNSDKQGGTFNAAQGGIEGQQQKV